MASSRGSNVPRWYQLSILYAMNVISVACIFIAVVVTLLVIVDLIEHLGRGARWYAVPVGLLVALVGLVIWRGTAALIRRAERGQSLF